MKFPFFLISILLLSSCTIDWNDEKNKKIAELNKQIDSLEYQNLELKNLTLSGNTCDMRLNECLTHKKDGGSSSVKDFWSGFILSQTDKETLLSYSGKVIKKWTHIPPQQVPFVWDEACVDFFEIMDMIPLADREKNPKWKQNAWNSFSEENKITCMKENLLQSIQVNAIDSRFYKIWRWHYEWAEIWVFDSLSWNIQDIPDNADFILIESTSSGLLMNIKNERWEIWGYKIYFSNDFLTLLSKTELPY